MQVRVKDSATDREAYDLARRVLALCAPYGATCLVNDRVHVALAVGAAGGHVGADDLPVAAARRVLGPDRACSAPPPATRRRAAEARRRGRRLPGRRAGHATATKDGLPDPIGPGRGRAVADAVDVPVIAIGGVTADRVPALLAAGAYGVAVVGARLRRRRPGAGDRRAARGADVLTAGRRDRRRRRPVRRRRAG